MQEHGVPVTFAYISDAHDDHTLGAAPPGPGEAHYQQQLADYDAAFQAFFSGSRRRASTRATRSSSSPSTRVTTSPAARHAQSDGSLTYTHTPCPPQTPTCPANQIGEITTNLKGLLPAGEPPFDLHIDDAPTIYVNGQPTRTDPDRPPARA